MVSQGIYLVKKFKIFQEILLLSFKCASQVRKNFETIKFPSNGMKNMIWNHPPICKSSDWDYFDGVSQG
jgi:hypothetical protein